VELGKIINVAWSAAIHNVADGGQLFMAPTALMAQDLGLSSMCSICYCIWHNESIKWSLSIIVQICGVPTFLGLHSHLLSTNARCLVISTIWSIFTARRYVKCGICRRRVSAGFVLTIASRGLSAIAELLVISLSVNYLY